MMGVKEDEDELNSKTKKQDSNKTHTWSSVKKEKTLLFVIPKQE